MSPWLQRLYVNTEQILLRKPMDLPEPNFLVIGGMRCATGWIRQCLKEHPQVYLPQREPHFFDQNYEKGKEWWLAFFDGWRGEKAVGEKTATYMCSEAAPGRIAEVNPDMKLVCCVRDPVERMYSQYMMNRSESEDYREAGFEDLATPGGEYFQRSLYYTHVSNYLRYFPQENLLILVYEDKDRDPYRFLGEIFRFIEVDPGFRPPSATVQTKQGALEYSSTALNMASEVLLHPRSPRLVKRLYSGLRPKTPETDIDEKIYLDLGPHFADEIKGLEEILGRKLTCWRTRAYADI